MKIAKSATYGTDIHVQKIVSIRTSEVFHNEPLDVTDFPEDFDTPDDSETVPEPTETNVLTDDEDN